MLILRNWKCVGFGLMTTCEALLEKMMKAMKIATIGLKAVFLMIACACVREQSYTTSAPEARRETEGARHPASNSTTSKQPSDQLVPDSKLSYSEFMHLQQSRWANRQEIVTLQSDGMGVSSRNVWCAPDNKGCRGRFVTVSSGYGTCSGALVGEKLVITNRHCVEPLLKSGLGSIFVNLPFSSNRSRDIEREAGSKTAAVKSISVVSPIDY